MTGYPYDTIIIGLDRIERAGIDLDTVSAALSSLPEAAGFLLIAASNPVPAHYRDWFCSLAAGVVPRWAR
jgi:hypothetical protein